MTALALLLILAGLVAWGVAFVKREAARRLAAEKRRLLLERVGLHAPLDVEQLLAKGSLTGPHRPTRPVLLTLAGRARATAAELLAWLASPRAF